MAFAPYSAVGGGVVEGQATWSYRSERCFRCNSVVPRGDPRRNIVFFERRMRVICTTCNEHIDINNHVDINNDVDINNINTTPRSHAPIENINVFKPKEPRLSRCKQEIQEILFENAEQIPNGLYKKLMDALLIQD